MIPEFDDDIMLDDIEDELEPDATFLLDSERMEISRMIDGLEALKQSIYCILQTERYEHEMYSENYGTEIIGSIGEPNQFLYADIEDTITEALLEDDRIEAADTFSFDKNGATLLIKFHVLSSFGDIEINKEVDLNGRVDR